MTTSTGLRFVKGHGTQNDFVILADPAADLDIDASLVAALCDRPRGIGADGLLRVARAGALVAAGVLEMLPDGVAPDDWFMDYRNADGSIAEMCGNGVRVFAHFLRARGLVDVDEFTVGSRAGGRPVTVHSHDALSADVTVEMGQATVDFDAAVRIGDDLYVGTKVDVGNPHLACVVGDLDVDELAAVDFTAGVRLEAADFPHGANVELLTRPAVADDGVLTAHMRVFERGVGETRSCGTGLVAAAAAAFAGRGEPGGDLRIHVPGGTVLVTIAATGTRLRGPSMLVAEGELRDGWCGGPGGK
ncbi:diaminopimelate epimerase [Gordonia bronchialis DSM 43247]|uniref:Diaminopimelate epimerase n=1 Tax=Gordonia bronchialis (strain ATCC 25592 / DSM 43247 / BCRC 13721 / JCM 3198 / KCTC 3076 / NBRC 16047 / NCTC 10667) TaxID=526226 RepID=D0LBP8_GORB4|nr:diaminopimelate epimerase [Gordonia bronchialis]ACY21462.1 diaminopimelate epimerase [Gordonia bronchialis DSM 43247]MCC3324245.1 diaminopimelate epimerase [Gordonia bronchialis]QGS24882.1 diaminopimelate epimerase [Gordonia bronchialis]STQ64343.1 Diaminopimelate epimerase [Gordonia bronchialis]